jgi:hypothetical protein
VVGMSHELGDPRGVDMAPVSYGSCQELLPCARGNDTPTTKVGGPALMPMPRVARQVTLHCVR